MSTLAHTAPDGEGERRHLARESEKLFLLDLLRSPHGVAALTAAPPPYDRKPFKDGGRWRGCVPKALLRRGIVAPVTVADAAGFTPAERPTRHRTCVRLWRLIDRPAAERRACELAAATPTRPPDRTLFDLIDDPLTD